MPGLPVKRLEAEMVRHSVSAYWQRLHEFQGLRARARITSHFGLHLHAISARVSPSMTRRLSLRSVRAGEFLDVATAMPADSLNRIERIWHGSGAQNGKLFLRGPLVGSVVSVAGFFLFPPG